MGKLTAKFVENSKTKPGRHADGEGLYLKVEAVGKVMAAARKAGKPNILSGEPIFDGRLKKGQRRGLPNRADAPPLPPGFTLDQ